MPQLRSLDGQEVSYQDKVKADILFGADLNNKAEIFNSFLPDEQFIDRRLFVEDQIDPESDSDDEIENYAKTKDLMSKNITLSSINDKKTK